MASERETGSGRVPDVVLVTGGAGFIGAHLCGRLLEAGCSVRILDNFDPYYDPAIKRRNVERLSAGAGDRLELLEGDFRDAATCARATEGIGAVVHLGALAGVRPSIDDPARYMDVNVVGTQRLLCALDDRPEVSVVFGSSSSVYGGNEKVPFSEDDPVDHPVSPYAASKKAGEVLCHSFHHLHGNPVTCLRLFTVYGPGQRPEMAIHKFSRCLMAGQPIPFFGDGSTARDYTYVSDIVDGAVAALERADGYRIYNLGGSRTTTLRDLVGQLEEVFDRKAVLDPQPDQPGDVQQTLADTTRAARDLDFASRVPLERGLLNFRDWYLRERAEGSVS